MLDNKELVECFIKDSQFALNHIYAALGEYFKVLDSIQHELERIEQSEKLLSDLFMYREQWSPNANYNYAQYVNRIKTLSSKKAETKIKMGKDISNALNRMDATVESVSYLAGTILQLAKQVLSMRFSSKTLIPSGRRIGSQNIIEIIWEGRNHAMHWEAGTPKKPVQDMLNTLKNDLGINIETGKNNCLSILGVLGWRTPDDVINDLNNLIK